MRVMVVWCPDWSVVAALDEADAVATLPRRRAVRQRRGGLQRSRPRRGRTPRSAPPRRPGAVPRAGAAAAPTPTATPGPSSRSWPTVEDAAPRGGRAASRAARRPGARQLVRQRDRRCRDGLPGRWSRRGVWDVRARHRRRPVHRRAGRPARRRCSRGRSSPRAGPPRSCAACPSTCCRTTVPRGRELVGLLQRLGLRTLGDLADLPGDAVEHRLRRLRRRRPAAGAGRGPGAVRRPHPAARARRGGALRAAARLRRGDHLQRPHHRRAASSPSSRTTSSSPPAVRVEAESDGVVCSSRTWLHPRHFSARDLVDRVHWQLQSAGPRAGRRLAARPQGRGRGARADRAGPVRARGGRAGGRPRRGAVGSALRRPRRARAWPGCRAWSASTPYAARCCRAAAAPPTRQALVPWGERAVDLRPVDRPWPGRVPGPGAGPGLRRAPGRRGRRRRAAARCASPTAAWSAASRGASGSAGADRRACPGSR